MTHRESLQQFIVDLDLAYDRAGSMRDRAFDQEIFNEARRGIAYALTHLREYDNKMTDGQAGCLVD